MGNAVVEVKHTGADEMLNLVLKEGDQSLEEWEAARAATAKVVWPLRLGLWVGFHFGLWVASKNEIQGFRGDSEGTGRPVAWARRLDVWVHTRSRWLQNELWAERRGWWRGWGWNLMVLYWIFLAFSWNLTTLKPPVNSVALPWGLGTYEVLGPIRTYLAKLFGLDQMWGVFAPRPPDTSFYVAIPGELRDGTKVDVERCIQEHWQLGAGEHYPPYAMQEARPQFYGKVIKSHKWYKFYESLAKKGSNDWEQEYVEGRRVSFGRWICRHWNRVAQANNPDKQLLTFDVNWHETEVVLESASKGFVHGGGKRRVAQLWAHDCF